MTQPSAESTAVTTTQKHAAIAVLSLVAIFVHLVLRFGLHADRRFTIFH